MSVGVASILTECKRANVRRFIMQSGIGLGDGRELSCFSRFVVRVSGRIFTAAVTDKTAAERMTQKIDMEWVIVRPVVLAELSRPHFHARRLLPICRESGSQILGLFHGT
jgi:NAD(P)H-binding